MTVPTRGLQVFGKSGKIERTTEGFPETLDPVKPLQEKLHA
jgi:hypothetical protein